MPYDTEYKLATQPHPFPPECWLDEHNARVASRIHAADVKRFLREQFGDDTQETY